LLTGLISACLLTLAQTRIPAAGIASIAKQFPDEYHLNIFGADKVERRQ
jgi:hypothetical protein